MKTWLMMGLALAVGASLAASALAQRGPGPGFRGGRGPGFQQGQGPGFQHRQGPMQDERHAADRDLFHFLLTNHDKIARKVKNRPDGVETLTESDDPQIAAKIREHVKWMAHRVENNHPIRRRDPLFDELFRHADKIKIEREETAKGVRIVETSQDPHTVKLIQAHARVVSEFVKRGFVEARKNHPVPGKHDGAKLEFHHPAIKQFGAVVQLPAAAQQPRPGARIVVDVTMGGEANKLNPALEKAARFVNIYAGAGQASAEVKIALVLHGDATLCALNDDAYAAKFKTEANPNAECLHALHEAGVQVYVCGQSLIAKGARPEEVVVFADVAVSALTSLVNLQADGYAYIPQLK